MEIPILIKENGIMPLQNEKGNWVDLAIPDDLILNPFTPVKVDLKIAMKLPEGYEAHILPRSSTFPRYGIILTNSMGIIDNSYCGNDDTWKVVIFTCSPDSLHIPRGTRLFQFRIVKSQETIDFIQTDRLSEISRGGYGSTGF